MPNRKGFTLMEVLIAASLFAILASIASVFFINITSAEKKTELLNAMFEDSRVLMETISREIKNGTIDYEEYYSIRVLDSSYYGVNRGVYASQFYDPGFYLDAEGIKKGTNPDDLGIQIFGEVIFTLSVDQNLGNHPYNAPAADASAFCGSDSCPDPVDDPLNQTELYLISADGRTKTILGRKEMETAGDYALVMLQMDGLDKDSNGVVDVFTCAPEYSARCTQPADIDSIPDINRDGLKIPDILANDAGNLLASPFIPLSPLRSSIKDLKFMIWPDEDPYKAFAEIDTQFQPSVTIIMTIEPAAADRDRYPGTPPEITLQTTVSAGVKSTITTYPPTKDLSWIKAALD